MGFTRLEDDNLLNGRVKRIFVFFLDAKVLQLKGNFNKGTLKHAVYILWFDEAVADIDREWTCLVRKLDFMQISLQRWFDGPMLSGIVDKARPGRC